MKKYLLSLLVMLFLIGCNNKPPKKIILKNAVNGVVIKKNCGCGNKDEEYYVIIKTNDDLVKLYFDSKDEDIYYLIKKGDTIETKFEIKSNKIKYKSTKKILTIDSLKN